MSATNGCKNGTFSGLVRCFSGAAAQHGTACLFVLAAYLSRSNAYEDAERSAVQTVALLEAHALRLFEAKEQLLRRVDERVAGRTWDEISTSASLHAGLKTLAQEWPDRTSVSLADAGGRLRLSSLLFPVPETDLSDRAYFRALETGDDRTYISEVLSGRLSGDEMFSMVRRRSAPNGTFDGVIIVSLYPEHLSSLYEAFQHMPGNATALLRADGHVLARSPDTGGSIRYPADSPIMRGIAAGRAQGVFTSVSPVDNTSRIVAYRKIAGYPLYVALGVSTGGLDHAWHRTLAYYGLVLATTAIGLFLLSLIALREVKRQQVLKNQLRASNEVLEKRVAERTADLLESNRNLNLLLKEVHHRVKNNLQIISSFLGIQSRNLPAEYRNIYRESLGRIQTMSLIHETLYGVEQFAEIDLSRLLQKLIAHLAQLYNVSSSRVRVRLEGKAPHLSLSDAIPVALIANEVLSNAFKHAFPDRREGTICIELSGAVGEIRLVIHDDGIGFTDSVRKSTGIGLRMIDGLCDQIGATCHRDSTQGTRFELALHRRPILAVAD